MEGIEGVDAGADGAGVDEGTQQPSPSGSCDVCYGTPGRYPVIDKYGTQLYEIACPECFGSGLSEEEFDFEQRRASDLARYETAMAEKRSPDGAGGDPRPLSGPTSNGIPHKSDIDP